MKAVSKDLVRQAAEVLGTEGLDEDEIKNRLLVLAANDDSLARRLLEWIPEAFGQMVVSRLAKVHFLDTFGVRDASGRAVDIPNKEEPILEIALKIAEEMFREETLDAHQRIAGRSAVVNTADQMLAAGNSLDGAVSATACFGLRAEDYPDYKPPLLTRFSRWLAQRKGRG